MGYSRIQNALGSLYGSAGVDGFEGEARKRARAVLFSEGCPIAEAVACGMGCTYEEAQDVAMEVVLYLIHASNLRFTEAAPWLKYLRVSVENKSKDVLNKRKRSTEFDDDLVDTRDDTREKSDDNRSRAFQILKAADDHWLGSEPTDLDARVVAAKLLYLDGRPWTEAYRMVVKQGFLRPPHTEAAMHAWITDVRVVRTVAYGEVYKNPLELTAHIVSCPVDDLPKLFQKIHTEDLAGAAIGGWTWGELSVIEHKFYGYRPTSRVHEHCVGGLQPEEVCKIVDRCAVTLPFFNAMKTVLKGFEAHPAGGTAFREARFWKRLAFQFMIADALPRNDFEQWLFPCTEGTGFSFKPETLQGWIANKRLARELREYLQMSESGFGE